MPLLSDVTEQDLDLEFAQGNDITMVQTLFHMRIKTAAVEIGSVG